MTNRGKSSRKGRGLRYLDLSFEKQTQNKPVVLNNGFRPHGGIKGTNKYPPSLLSFSKPDNYQDELQQELDALHREENLDRCSSPSYAIHLSKEPNHSGEFPLFIHNLLAPNKDEQTSGIHITPRAASARSSKSHSRPSSRNGTLYYRPNRTHQYLAATELKDCSQTEVNLDLGRPTRTTLLRSRQRCKSAPPVNAYQHRRELFRKAEENQVKRRSLASASSVRGLMRASLQTGESLHSFLVGARYNRSHYLDYKSLTEYGVYMPRNNPLGCFVINTPQKLKNREQILGAPPDLDGGYDSDSTASGPPSASRSPRPTSAAVHGVRQAWEDPAMRTSQHKSQQEHSNDTVDNRQHMAVMHQFLDLQDAQEVEDSAVSGRRVKGQRTGSYSARGPHYSTKVAAPHRGAGTVQVQGVALSKRDTSADYLHTVHGHHGRWVESNTVDVVGLENIQPARPSSPVAENEASEDTKLKTSVKIFSGDLDYTGASVQTAASEEIHDLQEESANKDFLANEMNDLARDIDTGVVIDDQGGGGEIAQKDTVGDGVEDIDGESEDEQTHDEYFTPDELDLMEYYRNEKDHAIQSHAEETAEPSNELTSDDEREIAIRLEASQQSESVDQLPSDAQRLDNAQSTFPYQERTRGHTERKELEVTGVKLSDKMSPKPLSRPCTPILKSRVPREGSASSRGRRSVHFADDAFVNVETGVSGPDPHESSQDSLHRKVFMTENKDENKKEVGVDSADADNAEHSLYIGNDDNPPEDATSRVEVEPTNSDVIDDRNLHKSKMSSRHSKDGELPDYVADNNNTDFSIEGHSIGNETQKGN